MNFHLIRPYRRSGVVIKSLSAFPDQSPADKSFQRAQRGMILRSREAEGFTDCQRAPRPSDPMDVILRVFRKVVVHYMRDSVNVNAARGNVRRHEHAHRAALEILEGPQALVLRTIGMQRSSANALLLQLASDPVRAVFGAGEDQHHVQHGIAQEMQQQVQLRIVRHFIDKLRDGRRRIGPSANLHDLGRALELMRQRLDFFGERG